MFARNTVTCGARAINILAVCIAPAPDDVRVALAACDGVEAEANHANHWMQFAGVLDGLCDFRFLDDEHFVCSPVSLFIPCQLTRILA